MTEKKLGGITATLLLSSTILLLSLTPGIAAHKVRSGDTLWDLAKKYHTTPKAIAKANGIGENSTLKLGKSLTIPGKQSVSGKASRKAYASKRARTKYAAQTQKKQAVAQPVAQPVAAQPEAAEPSTSTTQTVNQPAEDSRTKLVRTALAYRGARYRRGGTSRGGFDCSGFTRYVYAKYGVRLPHSSAAQARLGTRISKSELRQGDLVFFHTYRRGVSHVGIYIGNGNFVHAATYGRGVRVDALNSSYYAKRYVCARRVK